MILFYTKQIEGNEAILDGDEARHCLQVLRKQSGDPITFVDGQGGWYEGVISETQKRSCTISIQNTIKPYNPLPVSLHLAVAPTKNINRFEWILEKATEIGVSRISPILCRRSERKHIRTDRLEKILVSAMKQSKKATLPQLDELKTLQDLDFHPHRFIAHCEGAIKDHLWDNYQAGQDVSILIGPEGDFHPEEIAWALENDFQEINLGDQRLRTETAAITAVHTIQLANSVQ